MALHCASRLGFLSLIYSQRHHIAFSLGLIVEVPIAMCNSEYDFNEELVIQEDENFDASLPQMLSRAQEIHLFFTNSINSMGESRPGVYLVANDSFVIVHNYKTPTLPIFHPPS
jgi:hypothetical protein